MLNSCLLSAYYVHSTVYFIYPVPCALHLFISNSQNNIARQMEFSLYRLDNCSSESLRNCGSDGKESACNMGDLGSILVKKTPWRRVWQPTPVFLPGKFHGQRIRGGQWPTVHGVTESDTTKWLTLALSQGHSQLAKKRGKIHIDQQSLNLTHMYFLLG